MTGVYNTVNFEGIDAGLEKYISLDSKNSVIIGQDTGKVILVSSYINTYDNTFIGYKAGEFTNNISKTILIGENSGKHLFNGTDNILIGNDNNSNILYFTNSILIGTSNIGYTSNNNINIFGNYNTIDNNIDNYNYNTFIFGNNNSSKNTLNSLIIGNNNKIDNNIINSNYLYIGDNLIDNSNIKFNINNIIYETNNEFIKSDITYYYNNLHIADSNRNLIIGFDNIEDTKHIINKNIDIINHDIYSKNGLSTNCISFRNDDNNNITICTNNKITDDISYILPNNIYNFNNSSNYFLSIDSNNELFWYDSSLLNIGVYLNNVSNYIHKINNKTSNFDNSHPDILQLNSDFYINGVLTVDKINLTGGTIILTNDDLDISKGPQGPRGLKGDKGLNGLTGDTGPIGPPGDGIKDINYDNNTGVVTIHSDSGYEFQTGDLRGEKGEGYTNVYYNTETNSITFLGTTDDLNLTTPNLKGDPGAIGPAGRDGVDGAPGDQDIVNAIQEQNNIINGLNDKIEQQENRINQILETLSRNTIV